MYWKEWMQTILALVVLLGILEMLLPSGDLAKFAKLVLGLALMLAVLQPITLLFKADLGRFDVEWFGLNTREPEITVLAERVMEVASVPFLKHEEGLLITEIESVLKILENVEDVQVKIQSSSHVQVFLRPFEPSTETKVRKVTAAILNLPEHQISVVRWPE